MMNDTACTWWKGARERLKLELAKTEGVLEAKFLLAFADWSQGDIVPRAQVPIATPVGRKRADFVVPMGAKFRSGRRNLALVIEVDGREWHDAESDAKRDAALVANEQVLMVVHVPAAMVHRNAWAAVQHVVQQVQLRAPWWVTGWAHC